MLRVNAYFQVDESEFEMSYVRSSGPGGQNVNKVNSKCQLRWNPAESRSVPGFVRERLLAKLASRLTTEGDLLIASDLYRDQGRNREDCLAKLVVILREAVAVPKTRKATAPTYSSQRRRETGKRRDGEKKKMRSRVRDD